MAVSPVTSINASRRAAEARAEDAQREKSAERDAPTTQKESIRRQDAAAAIVDRRG